MHDIELAGELAAVRWLGLAAGASMSQPATGITLRGISLDGCAAVASVAVQRQARYPSRHQPASLDAKTSSIRGRLFSTNFLSWTKQRWS